MYTQPLTVYLTLPDGEEEEVTLPTVKTVCPTCEGLGKHSAHLGAYTMDEFNEAFEPEEQEAYFQGAYDRTCERCEGRNVVDVVDEARLSPELRKAYLDACHEEAEYQSLVDMERRAGC